MEQGRHFFLSCAKELISTLEGHSQPQWELWHMFSLDHVLYMGRAPPSTFCELVRAQRIEAQREVTL